MRLSRRRSHVNWRLASCRVAATACSLASSKPHRPAKYFHACRYPTARIDGCSAFRSLLSRSARTSSRKPAASIASKRRFDASVQDGALERRHREFPTRPRPPNALTCDLLQMRDRLAGYPIHLEGALDALGSLT